MLVDEALNPESRKRIGTVLADYVLKLDENPLSGHPERLPLRVIGDGQASRYHDEEAGRVTLHGREVFKHFKLRLATRSARCVFAQTSRLMGWEPGRSKTG